VGSWRLFSALTELYLLFQTILNFLVTYDGDCGCLDIYSSYKCVYTSPLASAPNWSITSSGGQVPLVMLFTSALLPLFPFVVDYAKVTDIQPSSVCPITLPFDALFSKSSLFKYKYHLSFGLVPKTTNWNLWLKAWMTYRRRKRSIDAFLDVWSIWGRNPVTPMYGKSPGCRSPYFANYSDKRYWKQKFMKWIINALLSFYRLWRYPPSRINGTGDVTVHSRKVVLYITHAAWRHEVNKDGLWNLHC